MMMKSKIFILAAIVVVLAAPMTQAQETLTVVSWNAESGDADPDSVAARIAGFDDVDIWGICEVSAAWEQTFTTAAGEGEGAEFRSILGTTGGADRLLILYDADRFELLGSEQLDAINPSMAVRSPLVGRFRYRPDGPEFLFMVNHLYRTNDAARATQSTQLNDWAEAQDLPLIAVGDYNYDWRVEGGEDHHDLGYDRLTEDDVFVWVRPTVLERTQHSNSYTPAVLDFVFLANAQNVLGGTSEIVVVAGDFPDNHSTPDHRPVRASLLFGTGAPTPPIAAGATREELLLRIAQLEQQIAELRAYVMSLPQ
jgi:hypothetical protein